MPTLDPVVKRHRDLEQIALAALDAARLLMESGARSRVARQGATLVAQGLGAERVHVRIGYASVGITVGTGINTITRMMGIGPHGVNLRLDHAVCLLCAEIGRGGMTPEQASQALNAVGSTPRHPRWLVALAVGLACAAFGRLLGIDWAAFFPVFVAGSLAQGVRFVLLRGGVNAFATTAFVAFLAAVGGGLGSAAFDSQSIETAMFSAVLLLVPGVPLLNAQTDIMEGYPTLGSARAISAAMVLVFITVGLWSAQASTGLWSTLAPPMPVPQHFLTQMGLGALAAFGFGMLFNFGWLTLAWAASAGALALGVRSLGLEAGWGLAASSFIAALAVGVAVWLLTRSPVGISRAGTVLGVAGCIPMIPGASAAHAIMGLFTLTSVGTPQAAEIGMTTLQYGLQAMFTVGAIGAGLTLIGSLLHSRDFPQH
jgi:uncharacterized membrane protein YjjP (DUF1212 family)